MNYYHLGRLPLEIVQHLETAIRNKILEREDLTDYARKDGYQWLMFDQELKAEFRKIFSNTELISKIKPNQKALISPPNTGMRIHKDGLDWRTALNIAVSCNPDDWIRWYSEEQVTALNSTVNKFEQSRNLQHYAYTNVPYIDEQRTQLGDVYLVNTDVWHSFRCVGDKDRIVIQTKFEGNLLIEDLIPILEQSSFYDIIK